MLKSRLERLLRCIENKPGKAYLYQLLGKEYRKLGLLKEMEDAYERCLFLDPCDPWIHMFLGNMYYAREEWEYAIERFEYARSLMPEECCPVWCLANVFERQGHTLLADEYYRLAVELQPDDELARRNLERWNERQRDEENT